MSEERRLAAIMFTDIVGYSALMGRNEKKALELLRKNRKIQKFLIEKHDGRWLKEMGDGILAQFNSAIDSVRCALEIQKRARAELESKIRIGIHLGDITTENEDVFGDGVNIASRLQAITDPGGIYVSDSIQQAIRGNSDIKSEYLGAIQLKNVDYPVNTYFLVDEGISAPSRRKRKELTGAKPTSLLKSVYTYIAAFLIITISITGLWIKNTSGLNIKALAVLPIENLSENTDQEWLAAGIHHALIDELSKIHAFRVVSRTSSMKYQDSDKAIPEIARELKVDGILEASFFASGENINIQVRLFKAKPKEKQIWRQDFDREMENILYIYNDVAKSVAEAANITLSDDEENNLSGVKEVNPKAYEAYLRGRSHLEKGKKVDLDRAMDYFELALEIDPDYALAYMGISMVWGSYDQHGFMSYAETKAKVKENINKALKLDSTSVEIRGLRAIMYAWSDWDWERAGKEFRKVIEINPNDAFMQAYYSHYLATIGEPEKGLTHSRIAMELDPFNSLYQSVNGMALKNARKYDEALDLLQELIKVEPDQGIGLPALWAVYHELGQYEEAFETAKKIYALKGNNTAVEILEAGNKEGGYKMAMRRIAESMIASRDTTYYPPWQICTLYCRAEMKEEALDWLELAFKEHDNNMSYISIDPLFDFLRDESRFKDLLRQMNLPEINFPEM